MSIGRLDSAQDIILDFSLPVSVGYNEATRLNLVNPTAVNISRATLILSPFYIFNYIVDVKKLLRNSFHTEGSIILDALTGQILSETADIDKKKNQTAYSFFSKSNTHPKDYEELLNDMEKNQIIEDLQIIKPHFKYKIQNTGDYVIIKHESKIPIDAARRIVKEEVVEDKKVKYENVQIVDRASACVYVPKWVINIESGNNVYTREILAASNTFLWMRSLIARMNFLHDLDLVKKKHMQYVKDAEEHTVVNISKDHMVLIFVSNIDDFLLVL